MLTVFFTLSIRPNHTGCGAAPLPSRLKSRFTSHAGIPVTEGYGLTECGAAATGTGHVREVQSGSVGLRLPFVQVKTVRVDDTGAFHENCDVDEPGVIAICGPNVFAGYVNQVCEKILAGRGLVKFWRSGSN